MVLFSVLFTRFIGASFVNYPRIVKLTALLTGVLICLLSTVLSSKWRLFDTLEILLPKVEYLSLVCCLIWICFFISLTFSPKDWLLVSLVIYIVSIAIVSRLKPRFPNDAVVLLAGITLGKAAKTLFHKKNAMLSNRDERRLIALCCNSASLLVFLIIILTFSSFWHLDLQPTLYQGPRWMGFWNNPNEYGSLMAVGTVLCIAQVADARTLRYANSHYNVSIILVAIAILVAGLAFSYSRGAWVATTIGLLYLLKKRVHCGWYFVASGVMLVGIVILLFWNTTSDSSPWYVKRLDIGRPSVQHRVAAWRGGLQMMMDYPFGVGWGNPGEVYRKRYTPPEGGAAAIETNDYIMLGAQLGIPGLVFFTLYMWLTFRRKSDDASQIACQAGALVMLIAFWFDGGLFKIASTCVFWILLELG